MVSPERHHEMEGDIERSREVFYILQQFQRGHIDIHKAHDKIMGEAYNIVVEEDLDLDKVTEWCNMMGVQVIE